MLLARLGRELERRLGEAAEGSDVGVHQARVASRRLREALPVVAPEGRSRRKAERKIRRLTRALGTVRELDVTVQLLDEFVRRRDLPRRALEDVRTHVVAERDRRREAMFSRLAKFSAGRLGRRLDEVVQTMAVDEAARWQLAARERVTTRAKRLRVAIHAAGQMYAPEQLHAVRIATKKLRYALELLDETGMAAVRPQLLLLKRAQETLGRLHDYQIIEGHVAAVLALSTRHRQADDQGLNTIADMLAQQCRHLHAQYIKGLPALLQTVESCTAMLPSPGRVRRAARVRAKAVNPVAARSKAQPAARRT